MEERKESGKGTLSLPLFGPVYFSSFKSNAVSSLRVSQPFLPGGDALDYDSTGVPSSKNDHRIRESWLKEPKKKNTDQRRQRTMEESEHESNWLFVSDGWDARLRVCCQANYRSAPVSPVAFARGSESWLRWFIRWTATPRHGFR